MKALAEAMQKRTMTLPPSRLPGVAVQGPDGKPAATLTPRALPPGLTPKPNAPMPKGLMPAPAGGGTAKPN
jgi:hypothetical protein